LYSISNTAGILAVAVLVIISCTHDINVPVVNSIPQIDISSLPKGSNDTLIDTVYYPDTLVCTLTVRDLNDNALHINDGTWPGTYMQLNSGYDEKKIKLDLGGMFMNTYAGNLIVSDPTLTASDTLPFRIYKLFQSNFEVFYFKRFWNMYSRSDTAYVESQYGGGLDLIGYQSDLQSNPPGLRSRCKFTGKFSFTIDYKVLLNDGSQLRIFVSPDSVPAGPLFGTHEYGICLGCEGNIVTMSYNEGWTDSKPLTMREMSGVLKFDCSDTSLSIFYCRPGSLPADGAPALVTSSMQKTNGVYVHFYTLINTAATSSNGMHLSNLENFTVDNGQMQF